MELFFYSDEDDDDDDDAEFNNKIGMNTDLKTMAKKRINVPCLYKTKN